MTKKDVEVDYDGTEEGAPDINCQEKVARTLDSTFKSWQSTIQEIQAECNPNCSFTGIASFLSHWRPPYLPAFHNPGWLLRYVVGPHDNELLHTFLNDSAAGITVGLTLVPQVIFIFTSTLIIVVKKPFQ